MVEKKYIILDCTCERYIKNRASAKNCKCLGFKSKNISVKADKVKIGELKLD